MSDANTKPYMNVIGAGEFGRRAVEELAEQMGKLSDAGFTPPNLRLFAVDTHTMIGGAPGVTYIVMDVDGKETNKGSGGQAGNSIAPITELLKNGYLERFMKPSASGTVVMASISGGTGNAFVQACASHYGAEFPFFNFVCYDASAVQQAHNARANLANLERHGKTLDKSVIVLAVKNRARRDPTVNTMFTRAAIALSALTTDPHHTMDEADVETFANYTHHPLNIRKGVTPANIVGLSIQTPDNIPTKGSTPSPVEPRVLTTCVAATNHTEFPSLPEVALNIKECELPEPVRWFDVDDNGVDVLVEVNAIVASTSVNAMNTTVEQLQTVIANANSAGAMAKPKSISTGDELEF